MASMVANPSYGLKLPTTAMGFSMALAKLITYYKIRQTEKYEDELFYNEMLSAYSNCEEEKCFSEMFSEISRDVDILLTELKDKDE